MRGWGTSHFLRRQVSFTQNPYLMLASHLVHAIMSNMKKKPLSWFSEHYTDWPPSMMIGWLVCIVAVLVWQYVL